MQLHEADDNLVHMRLTPEQPLQTFTGGIGLFQYLWLGVEHLVFGYDHILFVIGLMMLVSGWRRLVLVITGFTLAHSVTLGLSVLDVIYLPAAPVEAVIALSIVFVATELLRPEESRSRLTQRHPQIIALAFGLLHGFGFAGVLADIGLPRETGFFALALFNIGLEIGQLCVVGLCLGISYMARKLPCRRFTARAPKPELSLPWEVWRAIGWSPAPRKLLALTLWQVPDYSAAEATSSNRASRFSISAITASIWFGPPIISS